jgi:hypothetical protein
LTKVKTPAVLTRDWKDYFMIRLGVLNKEKALQRCALLRALLFPTLTTASC